VHEIKIIDFGLSTFYKNKERIYNRCGTPGFVAPEVISDKIPNIYS